MVRPEISNGEKLPAAPGLEGKREGVAWQEWGPPRSSCLGEARAMEEAQPLPEILAKAGKEGEVNSGFSPPAIPHTPANDSFWPN